MTHNPKMVTDIIVNCSGVLEGEAFGVIAYLQSVAAGSSWDYTNLRFQEEPKEYSEGYDFCLVGDRPENDNERIAREMKEAEARALRERHERKQYEALKKKFGE